jgi:hypothetical protein
MTDSADFLFGANLHRTGWHLDRGPKLILVTVRISEVDDCAFFTIGGSSNGIAVGDFVLIEAAQMHLDIFGPNVKTAARHIFAELFGRGINLGLKKRPDAARATIPPHKAKNRRVFLSIIRGEAIDRSDWKSGRMHGPMRPGRQIVGSDNIVVDPMDRALRFVP